MVSQNFQNKIERTRFEVDTSGLPGFHDDF